MDFNITDLRLALERDEMVPNFQPIIGLHTGRLTGFEVLARWQRPALGRILSASFISLAERNGLIQQFMEQVFRKAFLSSAILKNPHLMLSVNISPYQMHDPSLPEQIGKLAANAGFPLTRLMVEITESALLTDLERAKAITSELKELGCKLALDDFGTGYSSLAHLQALPFDELKVDRSFVNAMTTARESRKIVASIVGLGHSLGLITVAEGVETEEQAAILLWLGCEQGQGWLYGRPEPADGIDAFITAPPRPIASPTTFPGEGWATSNLEALPTLRFAQLQAIYEGAPVGLCFLDRNLRYVSLNQRLAEMNGRPSIAHIGKTPADINPELFQIVEPYLRRVLEGEAFSNIEALAPAREGIDDGRILRLSYQPAWDEADEVIGISVAIEDVTEQRRIERALRESADYQRHLAEINRQVPWIMDKDGNSLQVSAEWAQVAMKEKEVTRRLGWLDAVHLADLADTMKSMKHALRTGQPIDIRYRVRNLNGDWTWMRSQGSPKFGANGEIVRWYGAVEELGPWDLEPLNAISEERDPYVRSTAF
jgi:PAS domain S-box-containing protein